MIKFLKSVFTLSAFSATALWAGVEPTNVIDFTPKTIENNSEFKIVEVDCMGIYDGSGTDSPDFGKAKAEKNAIQDAVQQADGTAIETIITTTVGKAAIRTTRKSSETNIRQYTRTSVYQSKGIFLKFVAEPIWKYESICDSKGDPTGHTRYICNARAQIKVWEDNFDPAFQLNVEADNPNQNKRWKKGESFKNGEIINFVVNTTQDAFLSIFWIGADSSGELVAQSNSNGEALHLTAHKKYNLGSAPFDLPLGLFLNNQEEAREEGTILFVITKEYRPFLPNSADSPKETYLKIMQWFAKIPLHNRRAFNFDVTISK